ncbi:MAG: dTDP-glucose 4,6-dehydratase [Acidobacteria bacterium]|nr:dTDP-glucose 4,6-dehydratase [Acidobacteriota bacterium]
MKSVLITGGAGFIGSNFAHHALARRPDWSITVLDKLTYAGNPKNLCSLETNPRYRFVHGDIADPQVINSLFSKGLDMVFNFAAESHVDRSIECSNAFLRTDVYGVHTLLEAARRWPVYRFLQISTDEVYGSVRERAFREDAPVRPSNPYAASKAAAEALAHAYHATYGVPAIITRATNTYGPRQYPEKLIPLFITNALEGRPLPLYGNGDQIRDWLHVNDHCEALLHLVDHARTGDIYNIGAANERRNLDIAHLILEQLGQPVSLIRPVEDRPGHDRHYALDCAKLSALGWRAYIPFERGLRDTIAWYRHHPSWWGPLKSGAHAHYYQRQYGTEVFQPPDRLRGIR